MNFLKDNIRLYVFLLGMMSISGLFAQKWNKDFSPGPHDILIGIDAKETPDGGVAMSALAIAVPDTFGYLVKYDIHGNESWYAEVPDNSFNVRGELFPISDGYVIQGDSVIVKYDLVGNLLWEHSGKKVFCDFTATEEILVVSYQGSGLTFEKLDPFGNVLTTIQYSDVGTPMAFDRRADGNYTFLSRLGGQTFLNSRVIDENGNEISSVTVPYPSNVNIYYAKGLSNGDVLLSGGTFGAPPNLSSFARFDESLIEIWSENLTGSTTVINGFNETETGELVAVFQINSTISKLIKTTSDGTIILEKELTNPIGNLSLLSISPTVGKGFVIAGGKYGGALPVRATTYKLDSLGNYSETLLSGNVFQDLDMDCIPDNGEEGIGNIFVHAQGNGDFFAPCAPNGDYEMALDSGVYTLSLFGLTDYWTICDTTVEVDGSQPSMNVDIGLQPFIDCPLLTIDISAPLFRRCFNNIYNIKYCNYGQPLEEDAIIAIELDERIQVFESTIPIDSTVDNIYYFNGGLIDPFECRELKIRTIHECDSVELGEILCVEAHIYPDSICLPIDSVWDGSSIHLEGVCENDSVHFTIRNVGLGNMGDEGDFLVIEDVILRDQGMFLLDAGQETEFAYEAGGVFMRMEATQSLGHPGNDMPSVNIIGCGSSLGFPSFLNWFPQNDGNFFTATECREVIGSWDPNDKQGFPIGYGPEHYILPTQEIDYLIRFQNTGTDTAFTVEIRDTLSEHLDFSTIQFGASSHPYTFNFSPGRGMSFTFSNILLPDSTTNEPASHGFIKYKIKPNENIALGTEINNQAAIYFDFNEPVYNNTTMHNIGENYIQIGWTNT